MCCINTKATCQTKQTILIFFIFRYPGSTLRPLLIHIPDNLTCAILAFVGEYGTTHGNDFNCELSVEMTPEKMGKLRLEAQRIMKRCVKWIMFATKIELHVSMIQHIRKKC